jgi:hypothetical protein
MSRGPSAGNVSRERNPAFVRPNHGEYHAYLFNYRHDSEGEYCYCDEAFTVLFKEDYGSIYWTSGTHATTLDEIFMKGAHP